MIKIFLFGISGKMGKTIVDLCQAQNMQVTGGFDIIKHPTVPTFDNINDVDVPFDVIVDFTRPEILSSVIGLSNKFSRPVVIATTGYDSNQEQLIKELSSKIAVLKSGNMSIGINLMLELLDKAATVLSESFDCEIIEKHHNQKVDSPSGTAKMLAQAVQNASVIDTEFTYGREGNDTKRRKSEIGIHAIRGGTVVGEHEVTFYGEDEILSISHIALSRKIFANGSLKAAKFITTKSKGLYSMKDMFQIKE